MSPAKTKKSKRKNDNERRPHKHHKDNLKCEYSDDPKHIRSRIRRNAGDMNAMQRDVEMLYGRPVEEWDFEELQHGCPRKPNGNWPTKKPQWITPIIMAEAQRRLRMMSQAELGLYAGQAIRCLAELMEQTKSPQTRFSAAQYILNHIIGMPKAHVEHSGSVELRTLLAECIVNPDGVEAHPLSLIDPAVIDAEVVESSDDD